MSVKHVEYDLFACLISCMNTILNDYRYKCN